MVQAFSPNGGDVRCDAKARVAPARGKGAVVNAANASMDVLPLVGSV